MTWLSGTGLLASAFAPLVALLAAIRLDDLGCLGWIMIGASVAAIAFLGLSLRLLKKLQTRPLQCASVRRADERVLGFTSSYVVPIVVTLVGGSRTSVLIATGALVAVLAIIYVRSGLFYLNPLLAVIGYRLYEATATNGTVTMLLSRQSRLAQDAVVDCRYLGTDVAFHFTDR